MSLTLGRVNLTPVLSYLKNWQDSGGLTSDVIPLLNGVVVSPSVVDPEVVSIAFPLADTTLAKTKILVQKVKEIRKNNYFPYHYLNWTENPDMNGFYRLSKAALAYDETALSDTGLVPFSADLIPVGDLGTHVAALQLNKFPRTTDYAVTPQALHGFPYGAVVTPLTTLTRTGKHGAVSVVKDATNQTLYTYEQAETDMNKGDVVVYDTMDSADEANWVEVLGCGHVFTGDIVIDNGIIRCKTRVNQSTVKGRVDIDYWSTAANPDAWAAAGQYYLNDVTNTEDYGAHTPTVSLSRVSPEECTVILTYPPHTNTPRLSLTLARGRRDATCKVTFITGSAPADFKATWIPTTPMRYAAGDAQYDADGQSDGDKAIAVTTNNFNVTYDTKTIYFSGLAITDLTTVDSKATVATNKISAVKVRVAEYYHSVFAVAFENANIDDPEDLGAQLLYNCSSLPQVVER